MTASNAPRVTNPFCPNAVDLMQVLTAQLRSCEAEAMKRVVTPRPEEESWDGTEWDVRRTVL